MSPMPSESSAAPASQLYCFDNAALSALTFFLLFQCYSTLDTKGFTYVIQEPAFASQQLTFSSSLQLHGRLGLEIFSLSFTTML